jgi:prophage regulatory protein
LAGENLTPFSVVVVSAKGGSACAISLTIDFQLGRFMTASTRIPDMPTIDRFLNEREARAAAGFRSRSTLRQMIREGKFPRPVRISRGRIAWSATEIAAWQKARIEERDDCLNDQVVLSRSRK